MSDDTDTEDAKPEDDELRRRLRKGLQPTLRPRQAAIDPIAGLPRRETEQVRCDMILGTEHSSPMILMPYRLVDVQTGAQPLAIMTDEERDELISSVEEKKDRLFEFLWENAIEWHIAWMMASSELDETVRSLLDNPADDTPDDEDQPKTRDLAATVAYGPHGYMNHNRHLFDSISVAVLEFMAKESGMSPETMEMLMDARTSMFPRRKSSNG